ncbi:MAG: hypothetical protein KAS67_05260 [Thermoplasmata archaeon]|nr:hypothetical protein [Thermoplasmata archaeon]
MKKKEYRAKVLRKAMPAIILALFIFFTLILLVNHTEAAYMAMLAWIIVPVLIARLYARLKKS